MTERSTDDTWREIGRQFETLGENLSAAFRAAWEDERNRQQLREVQAGLENVAKQLGQAIDEAVTSPEGQRVQQEMERAAHSAHAAGKQAWQDARPQVADALRQVIAELEKMASRIEQGSGGNEETQYVVVSVTPRWKERYVRIRTPVL